MITEILLSLVIVAVIAKYVSHMNTMKKPDNFPPGPPSLPIYGAYTITMLTAYNNIPKAFIRFGNYYKTKVVGLMLGPFPTIVINDPKLSKEMLLSEDFDGRPDIILGRLRSYWKRLGIFFTDSYFWFVQRRYTLRVLRDYGFGRRDPILESVVEHEIQEMLDMRLTGPKYPMEKEMVNGELINTPLFFSVPFINGMFQVFSRSTLPRKDYDIIWDMSRAAFKFQRGSNDLGGTLTITPWLKDVLPNLSGYAALKNGTKKLSDFYEKMIREAQETFDESHERHFIDNYIIKMNEERRLQKKTTFSEEQLALICTDYSFPPASATQTVITMLMERMLLQPEIQDKVHEELDRVVGKDRLPKLDDRQHMPYVEACIREMMRIEPIVTLGVLHRAIRDTTMDGYFIPENTVVAANYQVLHNNKEMWGDPENFRPERFIKDGKLYLPADKSLPFGAGRRLCAGETYARQTMFQVFAAFMQAFHISTADGKPLKKPYKRIQGIITTLPEFWIRAMPR